MIDSEIKVESSPSGIHTVAAYITYLMYAAVVVRVMAWFQQNPPVQRGVLALLAVYGLVLFTEPLLTHRLPRYPYVYLIVQSILAYVLLLAVPEMDFLPLLYFPLSFQAVQFFKRRLGF